MGCGTLQGFYRPSWVGQHGRNAGWRRRRGRSGPPCGGRRGAGSPGSSPPLPDARRGGARQPYRRGGGSPRRGWGGGPRPRPCGSGSPHFKHCRRPPPRRVGGAGGRQGGDQRKPADADAERMRGEPKGRATQPPGLNLRRGHSKAQVGGGSGGSGGRAPRRLRTEGAAFER